jgi:plasmid stabilization system protein ParE
VRRRLISAAARRDRDAIDDHTVAQFGVELSERLRNELETTLGKLQRMPGTVRARPDLSPEGRELRSAVVLGAFLVVYEVAEDAIKVARILHAARDLPAELLHGDGSEE